MGPEDLAGPSQVTIVWPWVLDIHPFPLSSSSFMCNMGIDSKSSSTFGFFQRWSQRGASNCCTTQGPVQCAPFPVAAYVSLPSRRPDAQCAPHGPIGPASWCLPGAWVTGRESHAPPSLVQRQKSAAQKGEAEVHPGSRQSSPGFLSAPFCLVTQPLSAPSHHLWKLV